MTTKESQAEFRAKVRLWLCRRRRRRRVSGAAVYLCSLAQLAGPHLSLSLFSLLAARLLTRRPEKLQFPFLISLVGRLHPLSKPLPTFTFTSTAALLYVRHQGRATFVCPSSSGHSSRWTQLQPKAEPSRYDELQWADRQRDNNYSAPASCVCTNCRPNAACCLLQVSCSSKALSLHLCCCCCSALAGAQRASSGQVSLNFARLWRQIQSFAGPTTTATATV